MSRTPIKREFKEQAAQPEQGLVIIGNTDLATIETELVPVAKILEQPDIITALGNMIEKTLNRGRELRAELEKKSEELNTRFNADEHYKNSDIQAKLAQDKRKTEKARMMSNREIYKLDDEVKQIRRELKELKNAHSDYLQEYRRHTQLSIFELSDGTQCEMVDTITTRLVPARQEHKAH